MPGNLWAGMRWAVWLAGVLFLIYVMFIERSRLRIDRHLVSTRKPVHPGFRLRVLHVSDLHVNGKSWFRRWRLRRYARRLKGLDFDILVHTGDMLDNGPGIEPAVAFLDEVAGGRPAFTVMGNHDYHHYSTLENVLNVHTLRRIGLPIRIPLADYLDELKETARESGIVTLDNEGRIVRTDTSAVWLAGVDDLMLGLPDMNRALAGAPPDVPILLLAHNPDVQPWAALAGVDLTLAGHTHGGQISLPGVGPVLTRCQIGRDRAAGLSSDSQNGSHSVLHVSRGLGETLPFRWNCPHHATIIELVSADHHGEAPPSPPQDAPGG